MAEGRQQQHRVDVSRDATMGELTSNVKPSPIFLAVVGAFVGSAAWAWTQGDSAAGSGRWAIRLMVITGWVLSLCIHEFGHSSVAYLGGDRSVASKGYLTLDPRKYANGVTSVALPLLFLVMGGIGLPGGAVYIQTGRIRSLRMRSLMSLAGPVANVICGIVFAIPFILGIDPRQHLVFFTGLGFLILLQMFSAVLNLLPIPGLDGFGVIQPYLSSGAQQTAAQVSRYAFFILFFVIFRVPAISQTLWSTAESMANLVRVPSELAIIGQRLFQFSSL